VAHHKRIEIRWRDLDGFLHVNNSTYLTYLEEARDEFYTGLLGHDHVSRIVVRHVSIDFRSGLTQEDDHAEVTVEVVRLGSSSVTTREVIRSAADGRIAVEAESVVVHTDDAREAPAPFPDDARTLLEREVLASA
jgi:acyl-CoA thioester hydrolase